MTTGLGAEERIIASARNTIIGGRLMKYRFSKLATVVETDKCILIASHATSAKIELYEPSLIEEFHTIIVNNGSDCISSELECTLFAKNVLICKEENELAYLENAIEEVERAFFGLVIIPIEDCNLRCIYCNNKFSSCELTPAHYDLLLKEVARALNQGKREIQVTWFGGEALLMYDRIVSFSKRARQLTLESEANFSGVIKTNGVLLDIDTHTSLCDNGITTYYITLDGFTHDSQRVFTDATSSFDVMLEHILCLLESALEFKLIIVVTVTEKDFDMSFYDLFLPYRDDHRLSFLIKTVGQCGENSFEPLYINADAEIYHTMHYHKDHLKGLGYTIYGDGVSGILGGGCYASYRDSYLIRANGRIGKCAIALDEEINDIGYLDLGKGVMVIDWDKQEKWSYNPLSYDCRNCNNIAVCCNRSCLLKKWSNRDADRCCDAPDTRNL